MSDPARVFNRRNVRRHRDRAAAAIDRHDFLFREVGSRLTDRLDDVRRRFPVALDLGGHDGVLLRLLDGRGGVERLILADSSPRMIRRAADLDSGQSFPVAADEEALPFGPASFDLVLSNLSLHWVNDLPGALVQIRMALKPDGLFLAAMLGGETLKELREALVEAEIAEQGGLSPRVSPFADVRDAGGLLQRAGFALPVVDAETITVSYGDPWKLLTDLRGMGETNALNEMRKSFTPKRTLATAMELYRTRFGGADGRVPASFQVIYLTAWAPAPSQQKPLRPGSAGHRLADALGSVEIPAGDKAKPW
ncbi:MAG: methyltransferase domain-containing protein [Rhodospirillales bacterium]|nr:methyltransferase domain-containing protein [Rhodospirillales bacterium]